MHIDSAGAAFLAGMGTGVHCALMCGPMACALRVDPVGYHLSRVAAYTSAGALCGGAGQLLWGALKSGPLGFAPWLMLVALVVMAMGWERRVTPPAFVSRLALRVRLRAGLGWVSPLLPCGPLWLMLGVAASTGSTLEGARLLLVFAAGTLVLYVPLQLGWLGFQGRLGPVWVGRLQRGMIWLAAAVMAWRMRNGSAYGCCAL